MVYLVGAGPGDPGLITVKALDLLRRADIVLYDRLVDATLLSETKPGCTIIDVGKSAGNHIKTQDEIISMLAEYGRKGYEVVRLKGGDPFLFGRGGEEAEHLNREGIPFAMVPGVSAFTSVPAYAGIPLTHRNYASSVGVATGHGAKGKGHDPVRWRLLARAVDTIVVFMGVGALETITGELLAGGLSGETPSALIEQGSTPVQRVITGTLATIAEDAKKERINPPALLVVGKVAAHVNILQWYDPGPLAGLRIGITRPLGQSVSFSGALRSYGALPFLMPTIKTVDTIDTTEINKVMNRVSHYDYIVFSSTNGVESFFKALKKYNCDTRSLGGVKIASIGPVTARALSTHGINSDITAEKFIAEGLFESLFKQGHIEGLRFLLVRSDKGREILYKRLLDEGAEVDQAAFYSTQPAELTPYMVDTIKSGYIDIITFTSSSTVESFFNQIPPDELNDTVKIASIGPQTTEMLMRYQKSPDIEASEYTTAGLAIAILDTCVQQ
ncbi:uroporphyrinogen-III C-methyltransferase [Candidatus Latescibacterota bacterium]